MIRLIRTVPDKILREAAKPVPTDMNKIAFSHLTYDLFHTMTKNIGVGIAAPQIGEGFAMCIVGNHWPILMVNPLIMSTSGEVTEADESCLSIPDVVVAVRRPSIVKIFYEDEERNEAEITLKGLKARVAQHEIDHLNGVLITDHGTPK